MILKIAKWNSIIIQYCDRKKIRVWKWDTYEGARWREEHRSLVCQTSGHLFYAVSLEGEDWRHGFIAGSFVCVGFILDGFFNRTNKSGEKEMAATLRQVGYGHGIIASL